jgi:hypothetical protein
MKIPAPPGLTLTAYSAVLGTRDHNALELLTVWDTAENAEPCHCPSDRHEL